MIPESHIGMVSIVLLDTHVHHAFVRLRLSDDENFRDRLDSNPGFLVTHYDATRSAIDITEQKFYFSYMFFIKLHHFLKEMLLFPNAKFS